MATDQEQRQMLEEKSQIQKKNRFMGFYDAFWSVLGWSVLAGVIYFLLIWFFPQGTTRWGFLIGTVFEVIGAFLLFLYKLFKLVSPADGSLFDFSLSSC